jgi:hypothetical protein
MLVVNELMASNDSTVRDEAGDYDDWIEVLNAGARSVELDGLHLSDDAGDPRRWPLPRGHLAPGQRLLVWCDDDTEQGPAHAPFRLDADGEEVGIYDLDARGNAPLDRVVFPPLAADVSLGRSPDGIGTLRILPWPTPGEANP